ncbi:MAG: hypothetical protein HFH41_00525 [Lachnospiraceae bacterium]|nr:hypothetical protein [Lachnospiraceae bacterium]
MTIQIVVDKMEKILRIEENLEDTLIQNERGKPCQKKKEKVISQNL